MTRIAIIYNYGEFLGGGDLVMLNILKALIDYGYRVTIFTSYPNGIRESQKFFNIDINYSKIKIEHVNISTKIPHPYNIALISRRIAKSKGYYDLYILSDDIPKHLLKFAQRNKQKILVYSHYPHATRIILGELVPFKFKQSLKGRMLWIMHSLIFRYYYALNWNYENIFVLSNSTLTFTHINKSLNPVFNRIVYPPVQVRKLIESITRREKKNHIVYIGRIQPEKGIEDLLKALKIIKEHGDYQVRTSIIGFKLSNKYLEHVLKIIEKYSLRDVVKLHVNAPRSEILEKLALSKIIVHPAIHEAFGIAVVEGMAAGCTPIVRCSTYGPWKDILDEGEYGYCFNTPEELAQKIIEALNNPLDFEKILKRALEFDEEVFKNKIIDIINNII